MELSSWGGLKTLPVDASQPNPKTHRPCRGFLGKMRFSPTPPRGEVPCEYFERFRGEAGQNPSSLLWLFAIGVGSGPSSRRRAWRYEGLVHIGRLQK